MARSERDADWHQFSQLCNELRSVKNSKGVSSAVEKLQSFLSDDRARQLVHRWRSWGFLLNCLLHVLKEEMRVYLNLSGSKRKISKRPKMPQLRYWHYLRTELETAHVTADGPMLHLDPNGRDCIRQLFAFSVAVIDRHTSIEFERSFETLVDKEAWLTVEVLVQFRVYCAVLDYDDWKNMLEVSLGSFLTKIDGDSIGDKDTAATRARVVKFLVKNCPFDLNERGLERDVLPGLVKWIESWFEAQSESMESDADSLLLVVASAFLETLTDLMRAYFGSIGPYLLKRGTTVLEFIIKSNKARKTGLRGAPAEFLMLFFELYQHNVTAEPTFCYLPPGKLLREMKKLITVALGTDEINLLMTHFNSAREQRLGNTLGIDDQGIRHLACSADIIFYHDCLVSDQMQNSTLTQEEDLFDPVAVGSKRLRSTSTVLAWETVIDQLFRSPRSDAEIMTASSASPASQRSSTVSYLSRSSSQSQRTGMRQSNDAGSWLFLLLSILCRHGDYYMTNRVGDLMMVIQKLCDMLVVKELGKWQTLTLHILIQMAALSVQHRKDCGDDFSEHWLNVWKNLLRPELPYTRVTEGIGLMRGQAGDAVLTLLNCCISFGLVPMDAIEASCHDLWNLPAFRLPSVDTPVARGDTMRPYARTSMTSACTLLSLLCHMQIPVGPDSLSLSEDVTSSQCSVQSKLLRSLFDHLRYQVFRKNTDMIGNSASLFTKVDWQTEWSPMVYASVIQAFFGLKNTSMVKEETIFTPELIRKMTARHAEECDSWVSGEELHGFGVAFCMLESGLDHLSMVFSEPTGVKQAAFSLPVQAFADERFGTDDSSWFDGIKSRAIKVDDQFERLAVPTGLLRKLIHVPPQHGNRLLSCDGYCRRLYSQSLSSEKANVLQAEVVNAFSELLSDISSRLPSDGYNPIKGLRVLANAFDVSIGDWQL
ncbi:hypothetical protein P3T76_013399 [Phytophthora citrophthora]|uniref:Uncharacterized protein n=1 Tax=Phytophthora citrophthora TaxID=4793 RepID=A0AAD9G3X4_9STRA|nr:hypothetical protein P3T76_013399 [Phytophthora citrophthora]